MIFIVLAKPKYDRLNLLLVRVVGTAKSRRPFTSAVRLDDALNRTPRTGAHEEETDGNDEACPSDSQVPPKVSIDCIPVIVEPHGSHRQEAEEGPQKSADEGDEGAEDGNGRGNDVGNDCDAQGAGEPCRPVDDGVGGEVVRVPQETDEDELGRKLRRLAGGLSGGKGILTWRTSTVETRSPGRARP